MMKTYEKPQLVALSLGGNERLCGDCAEKGATEFVWNNTALQRLFATVSGIDLDGNHLASASELENAFTNSDVECVVKITHQGYCKYSATTDGLKAIAWS